MTRGDKGKLFSLFVPYLLSLPTQQDCVLPVLKLKTYLLKVKHSWFFVTILTNPGALNQASPGLWNGLPNDIRNAKTMDVFKSLVKTYLFRKAYACYF